MRRDRRRRISLWNLSCTPVEERHISGFRDLQPHPDRPDISKAKRGFLPDHFSFVPRLMAIGSNSLHGVVLRIREDKDG